MPRAGYTLIEMVIVVAIIAIVLLAVVTSLDDVTPYSRLLAGSREVAAAVRYVSSEAAATGRTHWLTYDLENEQHWIVLPRSEEEVERLGEGDFATSSKEDDSDRRLLLRALPRGVRFLDVVVGSGDVRTKGELKFQFGPLGFAPAHTVHLRYQDDEDLSMTISINPVTREPAIVEGTTESSFVEEEKE